MSKPRVLLDLPFPAFVQELFTPHCELVDWDLIDSGDGDELAAIQGVVTYAHPSVDDALLDTLPGLKVVSNFGVGVDHIDIAAVDRRGVAVGNTPGAVDGATADMTMALLLSAARNIVVGDRFARGPDFTHYDPGYFLGHEVFGSTFGIVGMGRIGTQVAKRARGFDMRVLYHNRNRDIAAEEKYGVQFTNLNELLEQSHFVSLNVPLTPETAGLIGEAELKRMREDAILVNVARGPVVDHHALHRALAENWIAGAALDVTEPEPLPRDHPLLALRNLLIAPHLGSATVGTRRRMGEMTLENLLAGLAGKPLPNPVLA